MLSLNQALSRIPQSEKVYGAAMTPEKYIFTVFESPVARTRTVDKETGELGWQSFEEWVEEVDAGRVIRLDLEKEKRVS